MIPVTWLSIHSLGVPYVCYSTFHSVRERENIGILVGDIFINPKKIQLEVLRNDVAMLTRKKVWDNLALMTCPRQRTQGRERKLLSQVAKKNSLILELEDEFKWIAERKLKYKGCLIFSSIS